MSVTYKDIDELSQKSSISGTEKLPVSDTEYITPSQIVANEDKFYFVTGSSSQAGSGTTSSCLSTKWEGTIPGVTTLVDGLKIAYRIKTNTGVTTAGAVLSIDGGMTYKPVVFNVSSSISTRYSVGSTILLTYNSTQTAVAYLSSNVRSVITGCWQAMDYDANTNTQVRQYQHGDNAAGTSPKYPLLARYSLANKDGSYDTNYSNYHTGATLDTSTGEIEATSFKKTGGTSSQFLKADGSVDSSGYLPLAGGSMNDNAYIAFPDSDNEFNASVTYDGLHVERTYNSVRYKLDANPNYLAISYGSDLARYKYDGILRRLNGTDYNIALPSAAGTLALTSDIPSAVTESTVSGWGFTKNTGTYSKPSGGIPATDLESAVQTSLGKADTALQSFTETDPTVPSWAKQSTKPTYTASEVGALPDTTVIPTVPTNVSAFTNDANYVKYVLCADEAAYNAIANKDSGTLYLIPKTS